MDDSELGEPITLDEFCMLLSQSDRRVELIGAFNAAEAKAGVVKDYAPSFQARFTQFADRPV